MTLRNIDNSFDSYQKLISFYSKNKDAFLDNIHIKIERWFAANMSSALGAILDLLIENLNDIHFDYIKTETKDILQRNGFLSYYGYPKVVDFKHTTIKYQKLQPTDGKYFKMYVINELIDGYKTDLPTMSEGVKNRIAEAIYEIFVNAQIHSTSNFIYTCGQFFPVKNKIEFTIVDTGIGFKNKINQRFNSNLSSSQAIEWAMKDKNTTKEGITGGIGLAILREFVEVNKGKMQIISNDGYYEYDGGLKNEVLKEFHGEFPGTIVNLQFRTDDSNNYSLSSEININDIF